GAIYLVDTSGIWTAGTYGIATAFIVGIGGFIAALLLAVATVFLDAKKNPVVTGPEGLVVATALVAQSFAEYEGEFVGKVTLRGELWRARLATGVTTVPQLSSSVRILALESRMTLIVEPIKKA